MRAKTPKLLQKRRLLAALALLAAAVPLAACGFSPLYGENAAENAPSVRAAENDIFIDNIPDEPGQYLRNALIDRFYSAGRPQDAAYTLVVSPIEERREDLDLTKSSDATRSQLRLRARIQLRDNRAGKVLLARELRAITSYNILDSQFTTRVSEENARRAALNDLARQIETQIALYFKR
jgi:LPS-assembly lipoprotein